MQEYNVQCTVYSVQCTVYSVQCTVYSVQCTVYSVQCTVYSAQCIIQCTVQCTVHCTLYTSHLMWVQEVMQQLLEPTDEEEAGAHDHLGEGQEPAGQQE